MQRPTSAPPLQQPHGQDGQPSIAELLDHWDDAQLRAYIANLKPPVKSYYEKFRKRRIAQLRSAVFSGMEAEKERLHARGVFQPHVNALRVRVKAKNAWHYALRQYRTSIQRNSLKEALRLPAVRNNKPEDFAEASLPTRLYDLVTRPEPLTDESVMIEIFPVYKMMADWVRRSSLYI